MLCPFNNSNGRIRALLVFLSCSIILSCQSFSPLQQRRHSRSTSQIRRVPGFIGNSSTESLLLLFLLHQPTKSIPLIFNRKRTACIRNLSKKDLDDSSDNTDDDDDYQYDDDDDDDDDDDNDTLFVGMSELQDRIRKQQTQYYELFNNDDDDDDNDEYSPHKIVHVIIFADKDNRDEMTGMHSLEYPYGSGQNIILAFESVDECETFAQLLRDDCSSPQFSDPIAAECNLEELKQDCNANGLPVKVVPEGTHLRPPTENVEEFGFVRNNEYSQREDNDYFDDEEDDDDDEEEEDDDDDYDDKDYWQ